MGSDQRNQGEGNREAARRYNKDVRETIKETDIDKKADEAKQALEGDQSDALKKAEEEGKSKARS